MKSKELTGQSTKLWDEENCNVFLYLALFFLFSPQLILSEVQTCWKLETQGGKKFWHMLVVKIGSRTNFDWQKTPKINTSQILILFLCETNFQINIQNMIY